MMDSIREQVPNRLAHSLFVPPSIHVAGHLDVNGPVGMRRGELVSDVSNGATEIGFAPLNRHLPPDSRTREVQEVENQLMHSFARSNDAASDVGHCVPIESL